MGVRHRDRHRDRTRTGTLRHRDPTVDTPETPPLGIPGAMVGGVWVARRGKATGRRPGQVLRSAAWWP